MKRYKEIAELVRAKKAAQAAAAKAGKQCCCAENIEFGPQEFNYISKFRVK